jgi:hypothetical protein
MRSVVSESNAESLGWSEEALSAVEAAHPTGMSVQQIVAAFAARGDRLTEATFRKYVQLGLLSRSHRVGRKGKHRGSQGLYPATTVRQIDHIRRLMSQGCTIEEIQREHLFVRGEVDALRQQLDRVLAALERARSERPAEADPLVARTLVEARNLGAQLVRTLETVERRLSHAARMRRAAV